MAQALQTTVSRLRRLAGWSALAERTDRQLLETFAETGDEAAFTALVRRHGPLVLGVTRRVLGNIQDAEDAFQATFLVLARKAGSVVWQDSVRNWLHGVAYRVAHKLRTQKAKRAAKERQARSEPNPTPADTWHELRGVLDEELERLPAKYRAPLILCYLEGKTRDEAAEELGWSPGSVKGRLERGREMLRQRLCRRGLTLPAALCAGFLLDHTAFASVPTALAQSAVAAGVQFATVPVSCVAVSSPILHLAQGVLQAMLIAKLKIAGMALSIVLTLGLGGAWVSQTALAQPSDGPVAAPDVQFAVFQEREERKDGERPREQRKDGARPRAEDRKDGDRPRAQERRDGDKPRAEERKNGDRPRPEERKDSDRARGEERKDGDKPRPEERRDGDRPRAEERKDGERPREERGARGIIRAVDLKAGTITIQSLRDGDRGETTFSLAGKDVEVLSPIERRAKLSDLAPGLRVALALNDQNDVTAVRIEPVTGFGFVIRADADKRTLTLRMPREGERPAEATLRVAPDAGVMIDGRRAALTDLRQGVRVQLVLDIDRQTVLSVRAGEPQRDGDRPRVEADRPRDGDKPRDGDRPRERDGDRQGRVFGTIIDIDQAKGTINVLVGREGNLAISTFNVAKDAPVKVMFNERSVQEMSFKDLAKPVTANLVLGDDKTVSAINITAPSQRGRIKSVDADKRTITLGGEERELTLELVPDAKVLLGRQEMRLGQLEQGTMAIVGLTPDRRRVLGIQIIRGDGERE
jgi:RNA polymerase sigma factor (sigma-70 family)